MQFDGIYNWYDKRQAWFLMPAVFAFTVGICHIWLCYAVCGNWRMYAVIRQEREFTVANEIVLLLTKCRKWLCYAVCGNRECTQKYGRNGNLRLQTRYSCCCRSVINGFVMRFVTIGECKQKYGRNGKVRLQTRYSCCCWSAINGSVMRFVEIGKCPQ